MAQEDKRDPYLAFLVWRNVPTEGLDSFPVQRLMGKRTRTLLPTSAYLLKPTVPVMVKKQIINKRRKQASFYNRLIAVGAETRARYCSNAARAQYSKQDYTKLCLKANYTDKTEGT